ncbi:MAG: hypothetical protein ACOVMP_01535 [Chthoniobacterales bacterium]
MSRVVIGIDNGLTGGIVALSDHPGPPIASMPMPTRGKAKGNEVDALAVKYFILRFIDNNLTVILENPGKHSPGVQALCSMWDSYGAIRGVLESRGIRHHRITPQMWQKVMLPGCAKGDTKPAALARARQLWPAESWLASPRCSKPHDGMIDAALIAEYGRVRNL